MHLNLMVSCRSFTFYICVLLSKDKLAAQSIPSNCLRMVQRLCQSNKIKYMTIRDTYFLQSCLHITLYSFSLEKEDLQSRNARLNGRENRFPSAATFRRITSLTWAWATRWCLASMTPFKVKRSKTTELYYTTELTIAYIKGLISWGVNLIL